jgi:2,3-bisphosphoglycerate-dependent phosphoglycerate mutase
MNKLHIYIFRHGQTIYNRDGIFTGWKDSKLTREGILQAKAIAQKLRKKKFQVAFYTKLSRSKDTLKEVVKFHPNIQIIEDNRMIERNYGNLNGKTHSEIIKKFGESQYLHWHRGFNDRPPKGESFSDIEKRVRPFIKDLIKFMKKNQVNVAISAHGNSIRIFRKLMEHASKEEACRWTIPYDRVYDYKIKKI